MSGRGLATAGRAAAAIAALAAGTVAYGRYALPGSLPLSPALDAEMPTILQRAGPLTYYVTGSGRPLLLVHSINAAASAYEIEPIFEAFRASRRVYALDLPGFGFSDRSQRTYDIRLYVDAITDMVETIRGLHGTDAIDVLALSLSSEFLARAATERPSWFRTVAFVTPTGFERGSSTRRGPPEGSREIAGVGRLVGVPLWRRGLYNLLVSRPSVRFFLEKTWGSKRIDEGAFEYAYLTAHQPGAENAPFAFLSGRLFAADIRTVYEALRVPALVLHGTKGDFQDFSEIGWTRDRPNWRVHPFETGALPQFERPAEFASLYRAFLDSPPAAGAPRVPS